MVTRARRPGWAKAENPECQAIVDWINPAMKARLWQDRDVANKTGLSIQTIGNYARGVNLFHTRSVPKLACGMEKRSQYRFLACHGMPFRASNIK
jgi:hypothetical protein